MFDHSSIIFVISIILHHVHHLLDFYLVSVGCLDFWASWLLASWAFWLLGVLASSNFGSAASFFLYLIEDVVVMAVVDDQ